MRFNLAVLQSRLHADIDELLVLAAQASSSAVDAERNALGEYALIQLQDSWGRFVRDLVLRSSLGNASRASGTKIPAGTHGNLRERDARLLLRNSWGTRPMNKDWEPAWTSVNDALRCIDILKPANASDLKLALGANTNPIGELKPLRNFAAHRGHVSAAKLKALAGTWSAVWQQPSDLALAQTNGLYRFDGWCHRFRAVAAAAVK